MKIDDHLLRLVCKDWTAFYVLKRFFDILIARGFFKEQEELDAVLRELNTYCNGINSITGHRYDKESFFKFLKLKAFF